VLALSEVDLSVREESITAVIGPNGAGKTTLFNVITNIYPPESGEVRLFGVSLRRRSLDALARMGLVRTFQTARILAGMSVLDNLLVGGHLDTRARLWQQALSLPGARAEDSRLRERAEGLLEIVGLAARASDAASTLSVGAQKLLEMARALMVRPRVLLLDEPAAGLNGSETDQLASFLAAIRATGITIVLVEHNMSLVMSTADEVVVLEAGKVIASGSPAAVRRDERVVTAYLGSAPGSRAPAASQ
jgi:branched-chain amino acid transport system ATP-binding protein